MLSLTTEQERQKRHLKLKNEFAQRIDRFKNNVNAITAVFIDPLTETKICTSPNGMSERTSSPYSGQSPLYSHRMMEKKEERRIMLQQLSADLEQLNETLSLLPEEEGKLMQHELDQVLLTQFDYVYYQGYSADPDAYHHRRINNGMIGIDGIDRPPYGFHSPQRTTLAIGNAAVTLKHMLEHLMPKCIILDELDTALIAIKKQQQRLQKKEKADPEQYAQVLFVANEMLSGITTARTNFIQSGSVTDGLKELSQSISACYTEHNTAILNDHRSHRIIQSLMNVLHKFMAYTLLILTAPGRLYDNSGVQSYVGTWFEPRKTTSFKLFDTFREITTEEHLVHTAGLN